MVRKPVPTELVLFYFLKNKKFNLDTDLSRAEPNYFSKNKQFKPNHFFKKNERFEPSYFFIKSNAFFFKEFNK